MRKNSQARELAQLPQLPPAAFPDAYKPVIEEFNKRLREWYLQVNGGLSFGTGPGHSGHLDGEIIDIVTPAANQAFPVVHNLGRVPVGYITLDVESGTAGLSLSRQDSTPGHSPTQLWVRSGVAGTKYRILVL